MNDNEVFFVRNSRKNFSKINEGDSSANENDIWDDSLLIEAYDKAVNLAQQSFKKKPDSELPKYSKIKKKGGDKWKVGDKCRCQYSEDLKFYEADIIQIIGSTGMCLIRYVGYENEEEVPLKNLKQSEGESARLKQAHEAKIENEDSINVQAGQDTLSPSRKKQSTKKFNKKDGHSKKRDNYSESAFPSLNFPLPQIENAMIPPPPPPHMFSQLSGDENEAEAMSAMLISWYMSGYHTGYYQGLKMAKKQ